MFSLENASTNKWLDSRVASWKPWPEATLNVMPRKDEETEDQGGTDERHIRCFRNSKAPTKKVCTYFSI